MLTLHVSERMHGCSPPQALADDDDDDVAPGSDVFNVTTPVSSSRCSCGVMNELDTTPQCLSGSYDLLET